MTGSEMLKCTKCGQHLADFAQKTIETANKEGRTVAVEFNGIALPINPGDTADIVVARYLILFTK